MQVNKHLEKAEANYSLLSSHEKSYYKAELNKMRKQYEDSRKEFFNYEKALENERPSLNEEEKNERDELLGGIDELNRQERQIDQIIKMGYEGHDAQRDAGQKLRYQRDLLGKAAKNTSAAMGNLRKANQKIELISIRNMVYVGSLYGKKLVSNIFRYCCSSCNDHNLNTDIENYLKSWLIHIFN